MDKGLAKKRDWSWVPVFMPGVAKQMKERRAEYGDAWVNECWSNGMAGKPGWFFAREGPLMIGTPDQASDLLQQFTTTEALVVMRVKPAEQAAAAQGEAHGAH